MDDKYTIEQAQKKEGVIKFYNQKGFGRIICDDTGEEIFYHFTAVADMKFADPVQGERVYFLVTPNIEGEGKDPFIATSIERQWEYGVLGTFKNEKFGFILRGAAKPDIYFQASSFLGNENTLTTGEYLRFTIGASERRPVATNVHQWRDTFVGTVIAIKGSVGSILPEGSSEAMPFKLGEYCSKKRPHINQIVSYLRAKESGEAVLVTPALPLNKFAYLGDENVMLRDLAEKALEEDWEYASHNNGRKYVVLWNYLCYTFERLFEEDKILPDNAKKIKIEKLEQGPALAVFNTGLVDKQYRVLYAFFKEIQQIPGKPKWCLMGFSHRGERLNGIRYSSYFVELPERAEYFKNPSDLYYDYKLRLDAVSDHIIGDRSSRLPKRILLQIPADMNEPDQIKAWLEEHLNKAIERAIERVKWNYKTAIPQYYAKSKKIQLLLPLCIEDPRKVDVALAVEREQKVYVGHTILELDWAYSNARLIACPDSDWLAPKNIYKPNENETEISDG